jgi:hypothetical protein
MELVGGRPGGQTHARCWTEISLAPVMDRGDGARNLCVRPLFKQSQLIHRADSDPGFSLRTTSWANENVCNCGCECLSLA